MVIRVGRRYGAVGFGYKIFAGVHPEQPMTFRNVGNDKYLKVGASMFPQDVGEVDFAKAKREPTAKEKPPLKPKQ